ncbi:amino acid adenylation domain-containing protein [Cupriavidus sp. JZ107]
MRTLVFAVTGNDALGARIATVLHEMGHTVHVAAHEAGPLRDAAEALGIPVDGPWPPAQRVEWLVQSHYLPDAPLAAADHVLAFVAHAADFPPQAVAVQWCVRDDIADRLAASRECAVSAPLCGADIALDIETAAEDLLLEFVSGLGRDAVQIHALPRVARPDTEALLDLRRLAGWHASNETSRVFALDASLPEMVARTARLMPYATALRDEVGDVDYRTFVGAAIKLARQLATMQSGAHQQAATAPVIAVRLRKSRLLYAAMLGAIGAGAAYLPLDPAFPPERVRTILEQSCAVGLITDEHYDTGALGDLPVRVLRYSELDASGIDIVSDAWPLEQDARRSTRCAVTIFTSGSTGVPKGVMLSHRSIVHFCHWYRDYIELTPASRVLQFCTVAFDVSLLDIFPTFLAGAMLCIPTEEQRHALDELSALIGGNALTHAFLPPALLAAMPDAEWPHLRHLLTGGDVCFPETIERWSRGRAFHNIFGPAECTVLATIARLGPGDSNRLIGKPMANVRCYVLDEQGKPVRTGEAGELCIAGAGVADGYLHQPELTARSFVANPFAPDGGQWPEAKEERIYRTGDIVQWDQHGGLHFVGRRDAQVKIRGFRVELGEIEGAILKSGLYGQCACVVDDKKRIRAFVTRPVESATPDALRERLAQRLPDFMLPQEVVVLERLPATHNGKIDRAALVRLPSPRAAHLATEGEPANEAERQLRTLWAGLLDLDEAEISRDDSFFHLGGHSLLVSRLMLAVKMQFAGNAPLARFMERPTIAALATLLTDREQKKGDQIPERVYEDMRLPDDVWPVEGVRKRAGDPEAVLLTGANGFLGSFLAAELIAQTRATVYCLIRAEDAAAGRARLDQALHANGLTALVGHPRVRVVLGDLARPRLGLSPDAWRHLAREIDAIYHNGAHVNHVYDYPFLYEANVGSTLELLRLACDHRNKSLHFVSTLSAASAMDGGGMVLEEGPAMNAPAFVNNGYNVSKWVSEHLVWEALQRGFDVTILRPGNITGVAATGLCQPDRNRILLLVKGSVQLGYAPAGDTAFDFSPVDALARAMVRCTLDPRRDAAVFHLQNPQPLSWEDYLGALARLGYDLTLEDPAAWRRRLPSIDERNALFDVVAFYLDDSQEDIGDMSRIACARTTATLARLGVAYPAKDRSLLESHFRYLVESGFLPRPAPRTARSRDAADALNSAPQSA